jgi:two-component system, NarL family, response regulator YdfI
MTIRNGGGKIRVLIAGASAARRAELERMVGGNPSFQAVGALAGLTGLATRGASLHPDVVLVDVPESDPQFASTSLLLQRAGIAVVALVDDPGPAWTARALRAGVLGVLARNSDALEIHAAIEAANRGLLLLEPDIARALVHRDSVRPSEADFEEAEQLTAREVEVLRMMAEGLGNKEIASRLGISDHTVKFHISSILAKLGAASRTEAVTLGVRKGLILL